MRSFLKAAFLLLAGPLLCLAQSAEPQNVAAVLNQRYANQTLVLRRAVDKSKQVYDSTGTLLSVGKDGPWTVFAGVKPRKIALSASELRIEGDWLEFAFDAREKALAPAKSKRRIRVVVKLSQPLATVDEAEAVLHRVFALTDEDVIASVPQIWKPYLKRRAALKKDPTQASAETEAAKRQGIDARRLLDKAELAKMEKETGVTPPKPLSTPEPSYSGFARDHKFQGLVVLSAVVGVDGKIHNPYITQPAGMGLDEKAIEAMSYWRFQPGMKNGRPVPVEMSLEVQFNLY